MDHKATSTALVDILLAAATNQDSLLYNQDNGGQTSSHHTVSSSDGTEVMNHLIEADAKKKSSSGTRVA